MNERLTADVASDAPSIARWRNAVIGAFGAGGVTVASWGSRVPAIRGDLRIGTAAIGLIVAGGTVGAIAGLLLAPSVLARLGRRRAMLVVIVAIAVTLAGIGAGTVLGSVAIVAVAFALTGVATATLDVLINVEGAALEREVGRTMLPRMHAAWSAGAALGAGIGAGCAALQISPGAQMLGLALVLAPLSVELSRSIPARPLPFERAHAAPLSRLKRLKTWLQGWADLRLLAIGVVLFGVEFGEGSANDWLSLAVKEGHHKSGAVAALLFGAFALSEATARAFGGNAADRYGRVRTMRVATALGILGVCLFVLSGSVWLVLAGVILWAVGVSLGYPLGMSAAATQGGGPARQVSIAASIGYLASMVGPPVVGVLAQQIGLLSALWLVAILLIAAGVAASSLRSARVAAGTRAAET